MFERPYDGNTGPEPSSRWSSKASKHSTVRIHQGQGQPEVLEEVVDKTVRAGGRRKLAAQQRAQEAVCLDA